MNAASPLTRAPTPGRTQLSWRSCWLTWMARRTLPARRQTAWRQIATIFAGSLLQGSIAFAQTLQPAVFVSVSGSVVRIEADREQGGLSVGSGVTIAPSVVVTNCHVTRDAAAIRISGGGSLWEVTGQFADGAHDVCFLRAPTWSGRPVRLGERESLQVGQE